jgi:hypothetical protein
MENEIKEAIKELANKSKTSKSHEALQVGLFLESVGRASTVESVISYG